MRIPHDGVGQVSVEVNGTLRTYNAKSHDDTEIATDDFIEVVEIMGEVLVVKRI